MPTSLRSFEGFVRGKAVVAANGQAIGEVTDLLFDSEQWRVQSLHLKLTSDAADKLGLERGRFHAGTVDLPVDAIQSVGDTVIILKQQGQIWSKRSTTRQSSVGPKTAPIVCAEHRP